jgi:hypothetical protein
MVFQSQQNPLLLPPHPSRTPQTQAGCQQRQGFANWHIASYYDLSRKQGSQFPTETKQVL